jgi:hypothetical protein
MELAWLSPAHVAQLFTATKTFTPGGLLGSAVWNERGLHARRVQLAYALNRARRARLGRALPASERARFDRDGYVVCPEFLPPSVFRALATQVLALRTDVRERAEGSTLLRKIPVDAAVLDAVPAMRVLGDDTRFRAWLAYGEGHRVPAQLYLQTVTQRPGRGAADPQCSLHRDTFHPTVKAWLYLTDVAETAGPLVYVPGSHVLNPARLEWERRKSVAACLDPSERFSSFRIDADELAALGYASPRPLAVRANTLIVADTFGFHARGTSQARSVRAEVWAIGRRSPFVGYHLDRSLQYLTRSAHRVRWRTRPEMAAFDPTA